MFYYIFFCIFSQYFYTYFHIKSAVISCIFNAAVAYDSKGIFLLHTFMAYPPT